MPTIKGIEIFTTGTWNGDTYTEEDIDALVASFDDKGFEAPVKLGHNGKQLQDGQPAYGWISKVYKEGKKLFGDLTDVPQRLAEAIQRKQYRHVSIEFLQNLKTNTKTLKGIALLGADLPAVKGLAPLDMAEIAFSEEDYSKEDYETKSYTVDVNEGQEDIKPEPEEKTTTEDVKMSEEIKEFKDKLKTAESEKEKLEAENKEFKAKGDKAVDDLKALRQSMKEDKVKAFCEKLTTEGKLAPALEPMVKDLLFSANDTIVHTFSEGSNKTELSQFDTMCKVFESCEKLISFGEDGKTKDTPVNKDYTDAGVEVDRRVKEFRDADDTLTYDAGMVKVFKEDPELKEEYQSGGKQ